jgi:hypothetical protein
MFEILKALRDLNEACRNHGTNLRWHIEAEPGDHMSLLKAEVSITEDDVQFVNDMQAMFAPREEG